MRPYYETNCYEKPSSGAIWKLPIAPKNPTVEPGFLTASQVASTSPNTWVATPPPSPRPLSQHETLAGTPTWPKVPCGQVNATIHGQFWKSCPACGAKHQMG